MYVTARSHFNVTKHQQANPGLNRTNSPNREPR
jgi:hypothetical protein